MSSRDDLRKRAHEQANIGNYWARKWLGLDAQLADLEAATSVTSEETAEIMAVLRAEAKAWEDLALGMSKVTVAQMMRTMGMQDEGLALMADAKSRLRSLGIAIDEMGLL